MRTYKFNRGAAFNFHRSWNYRGASSRSRTAHSGNLTLRRWVMENVNRWAWIFQQANASNCRGVGERRWDDYNSNIFASQSRRATRSINYRDKWNAKALRSCRVENSPQNRPSLRSHLSTPGARTTRTQLFTKLSKYS